MTQQLELLQPKLVEKHKLKQGLLQDHCRIRLLFTLNYMSLKWLQMFKSMLTSLWSYCCLSLQLSKTCWLWRFRPKYSLSWVEYQQKHETCHYLKVLAIFALITTSSHWTHHSYFGFTKGNHSMVCSKGLQNCPVQSCPSGWEYSPRVWGLNTLG